MDEDDISAAATAVCTVDALSEAQKQYAFRGDPSIPIGRDKAKQITGCTEDFDTAALVSLLKDYAAEDKDFVKNMILNTLARVNTPLAVGVVDAIVKSKKDLYSQKEKFVSPYALTEDNLRFVTDMFPEYEVNNGVTSHDHPLAAVLNLLTRKYILRLTGVLTNQEYVESVDQQAPNSALKIIGGSPHQYFRLGHVHTHCCAPVLSVKDQSRCDVAMNAILSDVTMSALYKTYGDRYMCRNMAQNCKYTAEVCIFEHSLYDMPYMQIAEALHNSRCNVAYASFWYPVDFIDRKLKVGDSGKMSAGLSWKICREWQFGKWVNVIDFTFPGGSLGYRHNLKTYMQLIHLRDIRYGSTEYVGEIVKYSQGLVVMKWTRSREMYHPRAVGKIESVPVSYTYGENLVKVTGYIFKSRWKGNHIFWRNKTKENFEKMEKVTTLLPRVYFDKILSYACTCGDGTFLPKNLWSFAVSLGYQSLIVAGQKLDSVEISNQICEMAVTFAWQLAYHKRYMTTHSCSLYSTLMESHKAFKDKGIFKRFYHRFVEQLGRAGIIFPSDYGVNWDKLCNSMNPADREPIYKAGRYEVCREGMHQIEDYESVMSHRGAFIPGFAPVISEPTLQLNYVYKLGKNYNGGVRFEQVPSERAAYPGYDPNNELEFENEEIRDICFKTAEQLSCKWVFDAEDRFGQYGVINHNFDEDMEIPDSEFEEMPITYACDKTYNMQKFMIPADGNCLYTIMRAIVRGLGYEADEDIVIFKQWLQSQIKDYKLPTYGDFSLLKRFALEFGQGICVHTPTDTFVSPSGVEPSVHLEYIPDTDTTRDIGHYNLFVDSNLKLDVNSDMICTYDGYQQLYSESCLTFSVVLDSSYTSIEHMKYNEVLPEVLSTHKSTLKILELGSVGCKASKAFDKIVFESYNCVGVPSNEITEKKLVDVNNKMISRMYLHVDDYKNRLRNNYYNIAMINFYDSFEGMFDVVDDSEVEKLFSGAYGNCSPLSVELMRNVSLEEVERMFPRPTSIRFTKADVHIIRTLRVLPQLLDDGANVVINIGWMKNDHVRFEMAKLLMNFRVWGMADISAVNTLDGEKFFVAKGYTKKPINEFVENEAKLMRMDMNILHRARDILLSNKDTNVTFINRVQNILGKLTAAFRGGGVFPDDVNSIEVNVIENTREVITVSNVVENNEIEVYNEPVIASAPTENISTVHNAYGMIEISSTDSSGISEAAASYISCNCCCMNVLVIDYNKHVNSDEHIRKMIDFSKFECAICVCEKRTLTKFMAHIASSEHISVLNNYILTNLPNLGLRELGFSDVDSNSSMVTALEEISDINAVDTLVTNVNAVMNENLINEEVNKEENSNNTSSVVTSKTYFLNEDRVMCTTCGDEMNPYEYFNHIVTDRHISISKSKDHYYCDLCFYNAGSKMSYLNHIDSSSHANVLTSAAFWNRPYIDIKATMCGFVDSFKGDYDDALEAYPSDETSVVNSNTTSLPAYSEVVSASSRCVFKNGNFNPTRPHTGYLTPERSTIYEIVKEQVLNRANPDTGGIGGRKGVDANVLLEFFRIQLCTTADLTVIKNELIAVGAFEYVKRLHHNYITSISGEGKSYYSCSANDFLLTKTKQNVTEQYKKFLASDKSCKKSAMKALKNKVNSVKSSQVDNVNVKRVSINAIGDDMEIVNDSCSNRPLKVSNDCQLANTFNELPADGVNLNSTLDDLLKVKEGNKVHNDVRGGWKHGDSFVRVTSNVPATNICDYGKITNVSDIQCDLLWEDHKPSDINKFSKLNYYTQSALIAAYEYVSNVEAKSRYVVRSVRKFYDEVAYTHDKLREWCKKKPKCKNAEKALLDFNVIVRQNSPGSKEKRFFYVNLCGDVLTDVSTGAKIKNKPRFVYDCVNDTILETRFAPDGDYVYNEEMRVFSEFIIYKILIDRLPKLEIKNVKFTSLQGVPGCGKTTQILNQALAEQKKRISLQTDLSLLLSSSHKGMENLAVRGGKMGLRNKVATMDAFIMQRYHPQHNVLRIDEYLKEHRGKIAVLAFLSGATEVFCFGDEFQIPYIERLKDVESFQRYNSQDDFIIHDKSKFQWRTYRCPQDVTAFLRTIYGEKVTAVSKIKHSMDIEAFNGWPQVPYNPDNQYLVFTQADKQALQKELRLQGEVAESDMDDGVRVNTVGESQGDDVENVILVKNPGIVSAKGVYDEQSQILVALTRHKTSLKYYTASSDDKIAQIIRNCQGRGGGMLPAAAECDGFMKRSEYLSTNVREETVAIYSQIGLHTGPGVKTEVTRMKPNYHIADNVFEPANPEFLQGTFDQLLPGVSVANTANYITIQEWSDVSCGKFNGKINTINGRVNKKTFDHMNPVLRTGAVAAREQKLDQELLSATQRNFEINDIITYDDPYLTASQILDGFIKYVRPDRMKELMEPIPISCQMAEDWMVGIGKSKYERLMKQIEQPALTSFTEFHKYAYILKSTNKPVLEAGKILTLPTVQTIAAPAINITAVFSPIVRALNEKLLRCLYANYGLFWNRHPSEYAKLKTMIFPPSKAKKMQRTTIRRAKNLDLVEAFTACVKASTKDLSYRTEIDISKYDKSQALTALIFECDLMTLCGVHPKLVRIWYKSHINRVLKSHTTLLKLYLALQRSSGGSMTLTGNSVFDMGCIAVVRDPIHFIWSDFTGDDNDVYGYNLFDSSHVDVFAKKFNLIVKIIQKESDYFCSKFWIDVDNQWVFVPDPLKLLDKLGRRDVRDHDQLEEYRSSLMDLFHGLNNNKVICETARAVEDRYRTTIDCTNFVGKLLATIHDKKSFHALFNYAPDAKILKDPSKPKLA